MSARVLLIDDEVEFSEVLAERMKTRGLDVDTAEMDLKGLKKQEINIMMRLFLIWQCPAWTELKL